MHRFYSPDFESRQLQGKEAHHAIHVLRLKEDSLASVFDGKGCEAKIRITEVKKNLLCFDIVEITTDTPKQFKVAMAQALIKGKGLDWILQKATELDVDEIFLIESERCVSKSLSDSSKQEKRKETLIEACKQCGKNSLPLLHEPMSLDTFIRQTNSRPLKLLASLQPDSRNLHDVLLKAKQENTLSDCLFCVGPEGDFTQEEILKLVSAGFIPISLGSNTLRSETASLFLASILSYEFC